jgi:hypothetical protein
LGVRAARHACWTPPATSPVTRSLIEARRSRADTSPTVRVLLAAGTTPIVVANDCNCYGSSERPHSLGGRLENNVCSAGSIASCTVELTRFLRSQSSRQRCRQW